jgi:hypothetical protein
MLALEFPCHSRDRYSLAGRGLETRAAINATIIGPVVLVTGNIAKTR